MMAMLRILFIGENLSRAGEPPTLRETAAESNFGDNRMHRFRHQLMAASAIAGSKRLIWDLIERRRRTSILRSDFNLFRFPNSEFLTSKFLLQSSTFRL
jgi:hypothetical protein